MSLNRISLLTWKFFFYPALILIFLLELFFQVVFFFDIKSFKKTILFFNPYCDQSYWNYQGNSSYDENEYLHHSILTLVKKKNLKFFKKNISKNTLSKQDKIIFYGSSFIDHKYFIPNYKENINFAVKSYGLDQIYKSYLLTKDNFKNKKIVIGFLIEDIDRTIFDQRNFPKLRYQKIDGNYKITNTPILFKDIKNEKITFYTYNFIKNLIFLTLNEYNYKKNKCSIVYKKEIFQFFIDNIIHNSKLLNQDVIFVTFNFMEDIKNPNWRYSFVKDYFLSKNVNHLDMSQIISDDLNNNDLNIFDYYNKEDSHLNSYGFNLLKNKINIAKEQYK